MLAVCLHVRGITWKQNILVLMHMCIHPHQDILYFSISNHQPTTEWLDALYRSAANVFFSVGGRYYSSCLTVMSTWICVSFLLPLEYIHWSLCPTLLKPFKTERPKTQYIYATDRITRYSKVGLSSEMHWNTKVWKPAPSQSLMTFSDFCCSRQNHISISPFVLFYWILWKDKSVVIILICLFTYKHSLFIYFPICNITNIQNITHVCALPFISTLTNQWQIEEEKKKHNGLYQMCDSLP